MADDWDRLEGIAAAERILHAAVTGGAREIHVTADEDGATVFFVSPDQIEFFAHVPCRCRDGVQGYLRTLAAIDSWKPAPASGFGVWSYDGLECQVEVRLVKGKAADDVIVKVARCG